MKKRKNARKRKTTATRKPIVVRDSQDRIVKVITPPGAAEVPVEPTPTQRVDAYEVAAQKVEQVLSSISEQDRFSFGECNVNVLEDQIRLARKHLQKLVAIKQEIKPSLFRRIINYFDLRR